MYRVIAISAACLCFSTSGRGGELDDLCGKYERRPIENDWHEGTISRKAGDQKTLQWTNKAGVSWNLNPNRKKTVLRTDETNPYFKTLDEKQRDFTIITGDKGVIGFRFSGDYYLREGQQLPASNNPLAPRNPAPTTPAPTTPAPATPAATTPTRTPPNRTAPNRAPPAASKSARDALDTFPPWGQNLHLVDQRLRNMFGRDRLPESKRELPGADASSFDWTTYSRPNVRSQGEFNTCWAHAAISALEWSWFLRNGGPPVILSVQPILDRTQKTGGGNNLMVLQALLYHGTAEATHYPYIGEPAPLRASVPTKYRTIAFGVLNTPEPTLIKRALLEYGPLVTGVAATPAFRSVRGGVYSEQNSQALPDHSVLIVGWDDHRRAWKIQNSWGEKWGEAGFQWIAYGSGGIGAHVCWLCAQSNKYQFANDAHRLVPSPEIEPFPQWPGAQRLAEKSNKVLKLEELATQEPFDRYTVEFQVSHAQTVGRFTAFGASGRRDPIHVVVDNEVIDKLTKGADMRTFFEGKTIRASGTLRQKQDGGRSLMVNVEEDLKLIDR